VRRIVSLIVGTGVFVLVGVVAAAAAGVPEIDNANATFQMKATNVVVTTCNGEDGTMYTKVVGKKWAGGEVDFTPGSTDYILTGTLTWTKVVWTINNTTRRGIFRATAKLVDSSGLNAYSGPVVLITQGIPGTQNAAMRGWLNAKTFGGDPPNPPGAPDGGSLLANIDATIQSGGSYPISGLFGDAPPQLGYPNLSVTTINQTC
jgi:hypothetical protein